MRSSIALSLFFVLTVACNSEGNSTDTCGDGVADIGEACDGDDFGGETCLTAGYYGGAIACMENCTINYASCETEGRCGDGLVQEVEECDGDNLAGENCGSIDDRLSGTGLRCNDQCQFDTSQCIGGGICGNDTVEPGEDCEGDNLENATCETEGFHGGVLACGDSCRFDTSGCLSFGSCGDGIVQEAYEKCDGAVIPSTCEDLRYYGGTLRCANDCSFDVSECEAAGWCGDNLIQAAFETCDGTDLDGMTCEDYGYHGGVLACDADCGGYDLTDCEAVGTCGDNVMQPSYEACDGPDVGDVTCRALNLGLNLPGCNDDCTLDATACGDVLQWGTAGDDFINGLALAADGGVVFVGSTTGTLPGQTNSGGTDAVIGKLAPSGQLQWQLQYGSAGYDDLRAVKIDSAGDIIAVGAFSGDLEGVSPDSDTACLVAKFDGATGAVVWATMLGDEGDVRCSHVVIDNAGDIIAGGVVEDGTLLHAAIGTVEPDAFVSRISPAGVHEVSVPFPSYAEDRIGAMVVRSSGDLYVAINSRGDLAGVANTGGWSGFLFRALSGTLAFVEEEHINTSSDDYINALAIDTTDTYLIVAGGSYGNVNPYVSITIEGMDAYAALYNMDASTYINYMTNNGPLDEAYTSVIPGAGGALDIGGYSNSGLWGFVSSEAMDALFIQKQLSDLSTPWHKQVASSSDIAIKAMIRDAWGNLIAATNCDGTFPGTTNAGGYDFCLLHAYPQ